MTQATHTPAPWLCSGTSVSNPQANRPNAIICDVSGWGNRDAAEQIANARLIAAAPDLLAALENLTVLFDRMDRSGATNKAAYNDAIAAINKAKGA
jgi:hypothetical protein